MTLELDQLADRHLRADPQGVLAKANESNLGVVLVQASPNMAVALGSQHILWMLVSLLSRQFKVVNELVLDIPDVVLHPGVAAFGVKATLSETLEECVRLVSGPHIKVRRIDVAGPSPDVALVLGDGRPQAPKTWRLYADGWRYFVGEEGALPSMPPQSGLSIGPYLCASYAAGEVFKLLRGMKTGKGEFIQSHFASAWTLSNALTWEALLEGPDARQFGTLPHFYFAGAGAVAQAAALCLGSSAFSGSCSVVDKDNLDLTNDNRYALSTREDDGVSKVGMMQRYLRSRGFECQAVAEWWQDFASSRGKHAPNSAIRELERAYRFPIVLSCVDKNHARHSLQNAMPQLIVSGSTDGLTAKASIFDLGEGTACLKCHNPLESRNEVVQARIAALRQADGEQRSNLARELGLTAKDVELLLGPSGCGKLSEADLDRFGAATPQMSVGFVSAAAGVLLVAQFLRYAHLGTAGATQAGTLGVMTFARAKLRSMHVGLDQACDCGAGLRDRWHDYWTARATLL
jgi:molybdopterin/thiamine biosynthesis adenylyltransferase